MEDVEPLADTDGVDEDRGLAEPRLGLGEQRVAGVGIGDVDARWHRGAASLLHLPRGLLGARGVEVCHRDRGPLLGEPKADRRANAPAPAGHHGDLSVYASDSSVLPISLIRAW